MTIHITTIILILFSHWLADFFLQTDEQAKNKSKCNKALSGHVFGYSLMLFFLAFVLFPGNSQFFLGILWVLVNGVAHFFTDYVISRATSALYKEERFHEFFVVIGLDQFCHYITLFGTYLLISNLS